MLHLTYINNTNNVFTYIFTHMMATPRYTNDIFVFVHRLCTRPGSNLNATIDPSKLTDGALQDLDSGVINNALPDA